VTESTIQNQTLVECAKRNPRAFVFRKLPSCLSLLAAFFAGLALAGCSKTPLEKGSIDSQTRTNAADKAAEPWFEEIAVRAKLDFRHSSGHSTRFYMPEMATGGVGLLDFDGDGLLDVFCVNGGSLDPAATHRPGNKLYRNLGNWKFEDVTDRAGVGGHGEYGMGCACADYDGDGDTDIYVTNLGENTLYRNNGDGTFTDVTRQAGVADEAWSTSSAFFDFDGDGNLDLIVANYLKWSRETEVNCYSRGGLPDYCSPLNYKSPAMDTLYHNRGDGTFENVTLTAGLDKAYGNGLGVVCADFNRDGRIDIFVANDGMPNQLWINQGNGRFVDEAMIRGCAVSAFGMPRAGMGVAAVDILQHGWLDLFVTHLVGEGNGLFVNTNGYFTDTIILKGPNSASLPYTGFGVGFADFDNDGNLDLYVANGRVKLGARDLDSNDPYAEPNSLLRGTGRGQFEEVIPQGGVSPPLIATSRGAAFGDLDNDGGIDIIVINRDASAHLLRNAVRHRGRWITFSFLDHKGRNATGATVRLESGNNTFWRQVQPHQSYCSSNDPRVHFGLGSAQTVNRVIVRWPTGAEEEFGPFDANDFYKVREGSGMRTDGHRAY
jgi:hypothetical protein